MLERLEQLYRKPNRLRNYDYSRAGYYFITISSFQNKCTFSKVETAISHPTKLGLVIQECWRAIPDHFPSVSVDFFVLMPNHIHGIIELSQSGKTALTTVVNSFKSAVTRIARFNGIQGGEALWHRSFHDKVIRGEAALNAYREYISNNPMQWEADELHPSRF